MLLEKLHFCFRYTNDNIHYFSHLYWTDWGTNAKIERAALDGSERRAIVREPHVEWPNGLTIDPSTRKIYWCDGRLRRISSANLDGSDVKVGAQCVKSMQKRVIIL